MSKQGCMLCMIVIDINGFELLKKGCFLTVNPLGKRHGPIYFPFVNG